MAIFKADRFTHQNRDEYGQGKKVTTKILETDAKNTEYLLGELEETRQQIPATCTKTYAPIDWVPTYSQDTMEQATITEQDITSNTGKTYHIQEQKIWQIKENKTIAHLETVEVTIPGTPTQIIAPAVTTGTTLCQKSVMTEKTVTDIEVLGTLEEITGSNTGTVQPNSILQQYYDEVQPRETRSSFSSYQNFLQWIGQVNWDTTSYPFQYWLAYRHGKTFYGLIDAELSLPYRAEFIGYVRLNQSTTSLEFTNHKETCSVYIPHLLSVPQDYEGGDVLHIERKYSVLTGVTTDTINLSYNNIPITVADTPEDGIYTYELSRRCAPEELRVFKNNTELIQGIDYTYNLNTCGISIKNVAQDDYLEIVTAITDVHDKLSLFYDSTRDDTNSNVVILPVQVKYIPE